VQAWEHCSISPPRFLDECHKSSDVKRGQNLEAETEAKASRPRPRPKFWFRGHFGLEDLTSLHKRRLNQASFVLLCFGLFAFSGLCLVSVLPVFLICPLSCIFQHKPLYSLFVLMCR